MVATSQKLVGLPAKRINSVVCIHIAKYEINLLL